MNAGTKLAGRPLRRTARNWFLVVLPALSFGTADAVELPSVIRHSMSELTPSAKVHVGTTADWVAISDNAIWVGMTGPDGVTRIDPRTNSITAKVALPGNPCAGLAVGFGGLWVPLCAKPNTLARVDLRSRKVKLVPGVGPAESEGGIAISQDSVWLVVDKKATLARIDPDGLRVRQTFTVPPGSLNPTYDHGLVWITRSTGAEVAVFSPQKATLIGTVASGPQPRFADAGNGSLWTLNQGDGTLTRIDTKSRRVTGTIALRTPGHGGDIKVGHGIVWTTMINVPLSATNARTGQVLCQWVGPGGDSLGVSRDSIWLTDYHAGDVYRFDLEDVLHHCPAASARNHD